MKPTSHDLMRKAMADHGITPEELIEAIVRDLGGNRDLAVSAVNRFCGGGPGTFGVHASIIDLIVKEQQATKH